MLIPSFRAAARLAPLFLGGITVVVFALAVGVSDASAQGIGGGRGGQAGGGQAGGGGAGGAGGGGGGGGAAGGMTAPQPGNTAANEIGRAAERRFNDAGGAGGAAGARGARGVGGAGGFGGMRGFGGFGGMSPFGMNPFGANNAANNQRQVRTRLQGQVEIPAAMQQASELRTQQQVQVAAPVRRLVNGYDVSVDSGVATITGVASTEKDRRMAELLLKLEPGVRSVDNQIVVAP